MTRRALYLALGLALALAFIVAITVSRPATAAPPVSARGETAALVACGTPEPWTAASPIPTAVFGAMVASDGTYAYSAGGYSFQVPGATNQFARYDRAANSWTTLAPLPVAEYDGVAVYTDNRIYIFGGTNGSVVNNSTYLYDIATNTWSTGASLPAPRELMGAGYANGIIYIAGGSDSQEIDPQSSLYGYNIDGNSWTTLSPLPQAVAAPGFGMVGTHLYIAGGRDTSSLNRTTVYDYNTGTDTWTTVAPLLTGVDAPGSAVAGDELIVFGGGNPFSGSQAPFTTNSTQVYDPVGNTWTAGPNLNTARSFVGGTAIGNYLVAVGGYNGATSLNSVEVSFVPCSTPTATPVTTNTPTLTSTPTNTFTPSPTLTPTPLTVLVGHVTWQGIGQPDARNMGITATLSLCVSGVPQNYSVATDASGFFTVTLNLPAGSYNWALKAPINLGNSGTFALVDGTNNVEFGLMRAGDCSDNNAVNTQDFTILKSTFGKSIGDPGYDSRADFNRDTTVNTSDFTLLRNNFGLVGAALTCP